MKKGQRIKIRIKNCKTQEYSIHEGRIIRLDYCLGSAFGTIETPEGKRITFGNSNVIKEEQNANFTKSHIC